MGGRESRFSKGLSLPPTFPRFIHNLKKEEDHECQGNQHQRSAWGDRPYSQAVKAGNLLFVSGQLGVDPKTGEFVSAEVADQARQSLTNLGAILDAAGVSFSDVAKTTIFVADMNDFQAVNAVYAEFFNEPYPARACVQAARLPKDGRVEIEAVAILT